MTIAYPLPLCLMVRSGRCQPIVNGNNYTLPFSLHGCEPLSCKHHSEFAGTSDLVISNLMVSRHCCWKKKKVAVQTVKQE